MNEKELRKLLALEETETLELKQTPNSSFYKTISAFANTKDGMILLGVDKKGNITGVKPSSKFLEDLTNRIVNKISIYPQIETVDIDRKRVLIVNVARTSWLVSYEGRYYERVGNTTREMNPEKLRALLVRGKPWDSVTDDFSLEEIDSTTINHFVHLAVEKNRLTDVSLNEMPQVILEKLELMADGKLRNGALLNFWQESTKTFH